MIGKNFANYLIKKKIDFKLTSKNKKKCKQKEFFYLNLKNLKSFDKIQLEKFSHTIISIGHTSIDFCEKNKKISDFINVAQIKLIIKKLINFKIKIIYLSSDKVFNENSFLNSTFSKNNPNSVYGKQKSKIEHFIKKNCKDFIILRLSKVISLDNNLINLWIKKLKKNQSIDVFSDELISPIYIDKIIDFLYLLLFKDIRGILHYSSIDTISYYNLSLILAKKKHFDTSLIKPVISNNKFKRIIKMPKLQNNSYNILQKPLPKSIDAIKYF